MRHRRSPENLLPLWLIWHGAHFWGAYASAADRRARRMFACEVPAGKRREQILIQSG
jgi:hypothetical protein